MAIRNGATAVFTSTVPGVIHITTGTVDGTVVPGPDSKIEVQPGQHSITAPSDPNGPGGFRWTPATRYGWRK